ncbi:hypothetical protein [Schaalia sp. ZJ1691]|uniref:hypothetical protein n=1 Tax=Schaalia sp. ZJ1691 TaxID=2709404 RepID=UPI0013EA427B|nr:hypothetical protein [Schaalia sp. ZJ1691]
MTSPLGPQSSIYRALTWITVLMTANVVSVILGGFVITGGLVCGALTLVCISLIHSESASIFRGLATVARLGAASVTIAWISEVLLAMLLVWEWVITGHLINVVLAVAFRAVIVFVALILSITHIWFWPLAAFRMHQGLPLPLRVLPRIVKASVLGAISSLPRTLATAIVAVAPAFLAMISVHWSVRVLVWYGLIGCALASYLGVLTVRPALEGSGLDELSS